jgi:hypothetical protein
MRKPFGSLLGKLVAATLLLTGLAGGLWATSQLKSLAGTSFSGATQVQGATQPGITLDFPTSVLAKAETPVQSDPVVETVVVDPPAPARVSARVIKASAPPCVGQIAGLVSNLMGVVPAIVTPDQAQAGLLQANAIGQATQDCAAQVGAANGLGLPQINQIAQQLAAVVAQIQALPILSATAVPGSTAPGLGTVTGIVGKGLDLTLTGVTKVTGLVGQGLGAVLSPLN